MKLTIPRRRDIALPRGCVLYYDMQDMGNRIIDYSGFNRHGTNYGTTSIAVPGGRARSFDGVDDYVQTPAFALKGNVLTIGAWCKCRDAAATRSLVSDDNQQSTVGYIFLYRQSSSTHLCYQYATGSTWEIVTATAYWSGFAEKWLMVVVVADYINKMVRFFRNGRLFSEVFPAATMLFPTSLRNKYVGSYNTTKHRFLGNIGKVFLCEALLTDAEVYELFRRDAPMYGVAG